MKIINKIDKLFFRSNWNYQNIEDFILKNKEFFYEEIKKFLDNFGNDTLKLIIIDNIQKELEQETKRYREFIEIKNIGEKIENELFCQEYYIEKINNLIKKKENLSLQEEYESYMNHIINFYEARYEQKNETKDVLEFIKANTINIWKLSVIWQYSSSHGSFDALQTDKKKIRDFYKENKLELNNDIQFNKYGLLTIDDNFDLKYKPPQVYDKRINSTLLLKEIPSEIIEMLEKLKKYIKSFALKINEKYMLNQQKEFQIYKEHFEIKIPFSYKLLGKISHTQLYSDNYNDRLFIKIDEENITFEELLEDFLIEGEHVKTQVIHLKYVKEKQKAFITHIDHEYILYDMETFEERKKNISIKGKSKIKTFKIDDSKIPFYVDGVGFVMYEILVRYFKNKDLINEYFENIITMESENNG